MELKDEHVFRLQDNIDVYDGLRKSEHHKRGLLSVSSHRLVWRGASSVIQWHLSQVRVGVRTVRGGEGVEGGAGGGWVAWCAAGACGCVWEWDAHPGVRSCPWAA